MPTTMNQTMATKVICKVVFNSQGEHSSPV